MDENLVGYLLKSLDPDEEQAVEIELRGRPELQARLDLLRRALAPLGDDAEGPEPPPGLMLATLARVAEARCRPRPAADRPPPPPLPRRRWAPRPDLLVAAGLLIVVLGLGGTGLARLWRVYDQRSACANNLRVLWHGLHNYSEVHEKAFPRLDEGGARGVAGAFVPILADAGLLPTGASLVCPAEGPQPQPTRRSLRELEDLLQGRPEEFAAAARDLAGSYAYSLGYREGNVYHQLRSDSGDDLPILADHLPCDAPGNSPNHGGGGQNVVGVGGQVRWCTQRTVGAGGDDIYLNRRNEVRAGLDRDDTVLGCGDAAP
jgi:hypothetical protein